MEHKNKKPALRLPPQDLPAIEELSFVDAAALLAGEPLEECLARSLELSNRNILSLVAWNSVFDHCSFSGSKAGKLRLRDVRVVKCDMSNSVWRDFEASRVEFIGCRMTGIRAEECRWQDVLVDNCDMRYAQLSESRFRSSEFRSCNLTEADLRGANLEGAIFAGAILHRADLTGARLQGADLRGAALEGVNVRVEGLRGATVSLAQAIDLIRLLGVDIQ